MGGVGSGSSRVVIVCRKQAGTLVGSGVCRTYQRLVNTTPKPKATKKSSGELVGPELPPPPPPPASDVVGPGGALEVDDMVSWWERVSRWTGGRVEDVVVVESGGEGCRC